ncbi:MAG TPA: VOC family protein [Burkholderiaceae bacterium]|nr:VOC family protein [Burkholderiaceae bacterium]
MDIDHLVVGAATLEDGVAWCERVLGARPAPGGRHALMGTHNAVLNISSATHPRCYLEIIAIDPEAPPPGRARWFDLDQPGLRQRLAQGPGLIHWVARVPSLEAALAQWRSEGVDGGQPVAASRGLLSWQIALREDGRRLRREGLPVLIEWGDRHPCDALPESPVSLKSFEARDGLRAWLDTPLGETVLDVVG